MANLKRNMIELVTGVEGEEIVTEKYWTPPFIPLTVTYEALDLAEQMESGAEKEMIPLLAQFVAEKVYGGKFTKDQLMNGLHAPEAIEILQDQILFVAQGQQSDATKNFLASKN